MTNREQKLLPSARQLTSVRRTSNLNSLTGLPERLDFLRQVQQLLTEKKLNGWCVLSIDIEHFKLFNNWYGQVQGDELLHTIGHQLAQLAKENDYIAGYFGGDDFSCVCRMMTSGRRRYMT
ncbi:MAG: GGDEF domain-containing protein [Christensenellales bacterium]